MALFDHLRSLDPPPADDPCAWPIPAPDGDGGALNVGLGLSLALAAPLQARAATVDGTLNGQMRLQRLTVGRKGQLHGTVHCAQAEVRGHFHGHLSVDGRLTVYPSARIEGTVQCHDIVVWRGAELLAEVDGASPSVDAVRTQARRQRAALGPFALA